MLTLTRTGPESATCLVGAQTIQLSSGPGETFVPAPNTPLPSLNELVKAGVFGFPMLDEALKIDSLEIFADDELRVTTCRIGLKTPAPARGLRSVLPLGLTAGVEALPKDVEGHVSKVESDAFVCIVKPIGRTVWIGARADAYDLKDASAQVGAFVAGKELAVSARFSGASAAAPKTFAEVLRQLSVPVPENLPALGMRFNVTALTFHATGGAGVEVEVSQGCVTGDGKPPYRMVAGLSIDWKGERLTLVRASLRGTKEKITRDSSQKIVKREWVTEAPLSLRALLTDTGVLESAAGLGDRILDAELHHALFDLNVPLGMVRVAGGGKFLGVDHAGFDLTFRWGPSPSARIELSVVHEAETLSTLLPKLGLGTDNEALSYLPFTELGLGMRSLVIDTKGSAFYLGGMIEVDGATANLGLSVELRGKEGGAFSVDYDAEADDKPAVNLRQALKGLLPKAASDELTKLAGANRSKLVENLLDSKLIQLELEVDYQKGRGLVVQLEAQGRVFDQDIGLRVLIDTGANGYVSFAVGADPTQGLGLAELATELDIDLGALGPSLPKTRLGLRDLSLDTGEKRFHVAAFFNNHFDHTVAGAPPPYALTAEIGLGFGERVEVEARLDSSDKPLTLSALAKDFQLGFVEDTLAKVGDVSFGRAGIKYQSKPRQVELTLAVAITFEQLLQNLIGVKDLPDGIPTGIRVEHLTLTLGEKGHVAFSTKIELGAFAKDKPFTLAGTTELALARLELSMKRTPETLSGFVKVSGEPGLPIAHEVVCDRYALSFEYDQNGAETTWKLGGELKTTFFGSRSLTLKANALKSGKSGKIEFIAETAVARDALKKGAFAALSGMSATSSEEIFESLKTAKHLESDGKVSVSFAPKEPGFKLGLPERFAKIEPAVTDVLLEKGPFFTLVIADKKWMELDPERVMLAVGWSPTGSKWELEVKSSLALFNPIVDENEPYFRLKKGTLSFKHDTAVGETALQFEAEEAVWRNFLNLGYGGGVSYSSQDQNIAEKAIRKDFKASLEFGKLFFTKTKKEWALGGAGALILENLPHPLSEVLDERVELESLTVGSAGLSASTGAVFKPVVIPDLFEAINGLTSPDAAKLPLLGLTAFQLQRATLTLGSEAFITAQIGLALPERLNEVFGLKGESKFIRTYIPLDENSFTKGVVKIGTSGIDGWLENTPFLLERHVPWLTLNKSTGGVRVDFDKMVGSAAPEFGWVELEKLGIKLDVDTGAFKISGGYELSTDEGLKFPLQWLKDILTALDMKDVADGLPKGFPIKSRKLNGVGLKALLTDLGILAKLPGEAQSLLDQLFSAMDSQLTKLPPRFTDYLEIKIPNKVSLALEITADYGVSLRVETRGEPLQILIPSLIDITGIRLWRFAIGPCLAGSAIKVELKAEMDSFDYPTLALSYLLLDDPEVLKALPSRDQLRRTIIVDNLVLLVIIASGVPIPIPLFYDELAFISHGIEGVEIYSSMSFPKPRLSAVEALKIFGDMHSWATKKDHYLTVNKYPLMQLSRGPRQDEGARKMTLRLSAGPFYVRLPKYLKNEEGEQITIGTEFSGQLFDVVDLTAIALNGGKKLFLEGDPSYLVQALPIEVRIGTIHLGLFDALFFDLGWALATPKEFVERAEDFEFLGGQGGRGAVAGMILDVIRKTELPDNTSKTLQVSDKGLVAFVRGQFRVADVLDFSASGGQLHQGGQSILALSLKGRLGQPGSELLQVHLQGLFSLDKASGRDKKMKLLLSGSGGLDLVGKRVLDGSFELVSAGGTTTLKLSSHAGREEGPIWITAGLEGELTNTSFRLVGDAALRFWSFSATGGASIVCSEGRHSVKVQGVVKSPGFTLTCGLFSEGKDDKAIVAASVTGDLLGLIGVNLAGVFVRDQGTSLALTGKLTLLDKTVLAASATLSESECTFSGELDLFPGLETIVRVKGTIENGRITQKEASFDAAGELRLAPFAPWKSSTRLRANEEEKHLTIEVQGFLDEENQLRLVATEGGGKVTFAVSSEAPIRVLFGALSVTAANDTLRGPSGALTVSSGALEAFHLDGAVRFLGLSTEGRFELKNGRFDFRIRQAANVGPFKSEMEIRGWHTPQALGATTKASLEVDLAGTFDAILKTIVPFYQGTTPELMVRFEVDDLSIRVDSVQPESRENRELREARERADREMRALADRIQKDVRGAEDLGKALNDAATSLNEELRRDPTPARRGVIEAHLKRLRDCEEALGLAGRAVGPAANELERSTRDEEQLHNLRTEALARIEVFAARLDELNKASEAWAQGVAEAEPRFRDADHALKDYLASIAPQLNKTADEARKEGEDIAWRSRYSFGGSERDRPKMQQEYRDRTGLIMGTLRPQAGDLSQRFLRIQDATVALKEKLDVQTTALKAARTRSERALLLDAIDHKLETEIAFQASEMEREHDASAFMEEETTALSFAESDGGYVLHLSAKVTFELRSQNRTLKVELVDAKWSLPRVRFDAQVLSQLPVMLASYVGEHFFAIIGRQLGSLFQIAEFLTDYLTTGPQFFSEESDSASIDAASLLAGYAGLDREQGLLLSELASSGSAVELDPLA